MPKKELNEPMEEHTEVVEEIVEGTEVKEKKDSETRVKFRYFCDACTNIAFYSDEIKEGLKGTCQACGKQYVTRKENFIRI